MQLVTGNPMVVKNQILFMHHKAIIYTYDTVRHGKSNGGLCFTLRVLRQPKNALHFLRRLF